MGSNEKVVTFEEALMSQVIQQVARGFALHPLSLVSDLN
jgi:hypothetical protein